MLTDGRTDGLTDGQTENRTPISHPATSRCDKNDSSHSNIHIHKVIFSKLVVFVQNHTIWSLLKLLLLDIILVMKKKNFHMYEVEGNSLNY